MKIKRLIIKECLGIEELTINAGKVNIISGGNEKGKTSILETIEKAFFNTKRRARFVRTGADQAFIEVETDTGLNIKRTVKEDESSQDFGSVKIMQDGKPMSREPESFLKKLFGIASKRSPDLFSFSPIDFMLKEEKEQTAILLGMMPMMVTKEQVQEWFGIAPDIDYSRHGLQVLRDIENFFYEMRRETKSKMGAIYDEIIAVQKRLPDNYDLKKWQSVNLGSLFQVLRDAEKTNSDIVINRDIIARFEIEKASIVNKYSLQKKEVLEYKEFKLKKIKEEIQEKADELTAEAQKIEKQIAELQRQLAIKQTEIKGLQEMGLSGKEEGLDKELSAKIENINKNRDTEFSELQRRLDDASFFIEMNSPIDIAPLNNACAEAEEMKGFIPLASELNALQTKHQEATANVEMYETALTNARAKPQEILSTLKLPLKGLGIDNNGFVTINGLPIKNLSTSKQVRVCLDIAKAYAKDNPLKLICIDKLESLTGEVYDEFVKQMETDDEWQYFCALAHVERDENGKVIDDSLKVSCMN